VRLKVEHAADPALPRTLPLEHWHHVQVVRRLQIVVQLAWLFLLQLPRSLSPWLFHFNDFLEKSEKPICLREDTWVFMATYRQSSNRGRG
jgi:hypothetical protein